MTAHTQRQPCLSWSSAADLSVARGAPRLPGAAGRWVRGRASVVLALLAFSIALVLSVPGVAAQTDPNPEASTVREPHALGAAGSRVAMQQRPLRDATPPADRNDLSAWLTYKTSSQRPALPQEARLFYRRGLMAWQSGNRDAAVQLVRGAAELDPTFVFNITDILFEILALEKEREPFQDAANILNKVLDALLTLGEFQKASELLKRFYLILKIYELKDWQIEIVRQLIVDAGEPPRVERIGRVLEKEEGIRLEDFNAYLVLLQRNSIKSLIKLLGELKNSKTRRVICDALAEIGKNAIELIAPFIDDRRWFLVRNVTYILGRIAKEPAFPHIQKALNHEDLRVRREAIQALGLIGSSKAVGLLVRSLSDEDVRIRSMAAINLGKVGKTAGLVPLLEMVQSKEFQRREPPEVKAFFDAIGMVGSNEATPVLQQLLERKSLFGRGKADEMRTGAAAALAMIGTPEAKAILESGKESKDGSIRTACLQALRIQSS